MLARVDSYFQYQKAKHAVTMTAIVRAKPDRERPVMERRDLGEVVFILSFNLWIKSAIADRENGQESATTSEQPNMLLGSLNVLLNRCHF